ncbi:nucleoprotein TPR-like isoform X1 [Photinus pyralis]|uniref:nucleoprotein TPR-like isoform X1 n=1 Tax=Photinus pyralis TaxID=7054 RepID=UPI001267306D|nr:nucleoprotein TPR-like isoform X1 [Photinus pyralis]
MEDANRTLFASAISEDEWSQIPSEIAKKICNFVEEKFDELITTKALSETSKFNTETILNETNEKLKTADSNVQEGNLKLEAATRTIAELETQISTCTSDITKLQTTCNRLEAEAADCRHQKNIMLGEKDELANILERTTAEVERQKMEITTLTNQLHDAINAKCTALAEYGEIQSMKLTLEYKEKRLDQEKLLLNNQVETLTQSLDERTEELLNMKKDNSLRCVQLENKLTDKTQELTVALESIRSLNDINDNLNEKIEGLMDDLKKRNEKDAKTYEAYQHEIAAQTKLAELYKAAGEQNQDHVDHLSNAVKELQTLLQETSNKYGELETKHKEMQLANDEIIAKKNECIAMLKQELEVSNELFNACKDENLQKEIEEISPSAAAASRLIKPGMSLTQIYTQYVNVSNELITQKEECARLQSYIQHIINELEDKGPLLKKQREDYETAMENLKEVTDNNYALSVECQQYREETLQAKHNEDILLRENDRYKKEVADLSRQVCHLLREIELSRVGSNVTSPDQDMSDSMSSGEIISKRLVTFSDITELQGTNQRLLSLVRELSSKQEEVEALDPTAIAQLKMKLETMKETQSSLLEQQDSQNKMMSMIVNQRDMYKTLYEQASKGIGEDGGLTLDRLEGEKGSQSSKGQEDSESRCDDKVQTLEGQLDKAKKEISTLKEENDTYRKEKSVNEKMLVDQLEEMRKEVREVTRQNCKLTSVSELNDERFKVMQSNTEVYKKQISALEKQNKIYSESNIKHEQMMTYLKDETLQSQTKLSTAEVKLANLEKEIALLRDRESRLVKEVEFLKKETHAKNLLQTNIELIKATLERNDAESRIRLEERLDEAHRECAALRRRLQEEQDRFRELGDHLEKQTRAAQAQMEEEKGHASKLRKEVAETRDDLIAKQIQIEELTKKLKNSLMVIPENSVESHKFSELERILSDSQAEVQSLQLQLKTAKDTIEQHCNVAEGAENQLKAVLEEQEKYKKTMEMTLSEKQQQIAKLEEQCSELQGELTIQDDDVNVDARSKLHRIEEELKASKVDLNECKSALAVAQTKIHELTADVETAENKYTHEMLLHSTDLQTLTSLKEEVTNLNTEIQELKLVRDHSVSALEEYKVGLASREEFFQKEKEQLELRFKDLDSQNALLLDQIQSLNTQITIMQTQATEQQNQSIGSADVSFNRSFTDEDVKSSEQLLKIIKYLRQEKDISVSKCEILEAELLRLKSQHDLITKQLEDAKANLEAERQKSEVSMVTAAKHSEVLRKVETLNAITDSNRTLRQERDGLSSQISDLKARTALLEDQVAPLQEKNKDLSLKFDALHSENVSLRGEATRWRQRANMLIEKSNRTSPEDWKKLQNERENLAKQLAIEKGTSTKLGDDLNNVRHEKTKLEEQLRSLRSQNNQVSDDLEKTRSDLAKVREQVTELTHSLDETKENYSKLLEEKNKIEADMTNKGEVIVDLKNNLLAVRKIAKKYKQQCEDLTGTMDALKQENEERNKNEATAAEKQQQTLAEERTLMQERISLLEVNHNEKVEQLTQQISAANEEISNHQKEIESLKQSAVEKDDRFKSIFKNAKERLITLTEENNTLRSERSRSSDDSSDKGKNSEVEKLMKEKEEILQEKQLEKDRLMSEIETLTQRVNQLQRQLGQQGSKPTTSSGTSEKSTSEPPTANIKPMAGHSTNTQTHSVQIQPWRSGPETPLASIRPMSMQVRTAAVLPTSQGPSTSQSPSAVMVPPQQQVHTTGPSNIESLSSSPTSSHTEYMPATSSATPTVVTPRQLAVPPTQSTQDVEDDDSTLQPVLQQQAVALVLPRVEQPSNGPAQELGTSSSSSNTVTTTQAGLKRPRDVDAEACQIDDQSKQQQSKRTRIQQGSTETSQHHGTVTDSGLEVEYQVPTSSQRDHEEDHDAVIVVDESEDDVDDPDEGEGDDNVGDDPDTEGYDMESYPEQELSYDDADCQDMEEVEGGNEVEVVEGSSEVPNQSERSIQENSSQEESLEQPQSETISSGTDGLSNVTVSQASPSVAVTMPSFSRTRSVAPLTRQQPQSHLLLQHGMDEGGDDGKYINLQLKRTAQKGFLFDCNNTFI